MSPASPARHRPRLSLFWGVVLALAMGALVLVWSIPLLAMWLAGRDRPLPIPGTAMALYALLGLAGAAVYVTISDASVAEFVRPVAAFLRGPGPDARAARLKRIARVVVLGLVPVLAGGVVYSRATPRLQSPTLLRIQHPTIPGGFEKRRSPAREPSDEAVKAWMAATGFGGSLDEARRAFHDRALAEGRVLFQVNCRPCHGDAADGAGPMAWGFRLKPANFRDPGTIATVVEAYAFWRVTEGGPGLPPEASPSESAMPAWKADLTEEQRWKAVLAAYDLADVEPRKPEKLEARGDPGAGPGWVALVRPEVAWAQGAGPARADDAERGRQIYAKRCLACHGEKGDGRGPVADFLDPRPRDFVGAAFKLRTTVSGEAPTDEDLLRVLTDGMPGTAMSGWTILTEAERRQVIAYVKTFNREKFQAAPERPPIGRANVASSPDLVARGQEVYRKAKCWECHGDEGRGDGATGTDLKDDAGLRIRPADLTKGWRLKGGREARDIFLRLTTGLDGTPMPSFQDALPEDERWALAHYIRSLQTREEPGAAVVLRAVQVAGPLPSEPTDPRWRDAPPLPVPLSGQVLAKPRWENRAVDAVTARALYNAEAIAFLLEWHDRVKDTVHAPGADPELKDATYPRINLAQDLSERLRDAVRLQFPATATTGPDRPHFFLGQAGRPVTLWHWKADLNEDPARRSAVEEETAEGVQKPIVTQPADSQDVVGRGVWDKGRWRVVMTRALVGRDRGKDVTFEPGTLIPFAIHAWDGSNGEKGLMMALSSWNFVALEVPTPLSAYLASVVGLLVIGIVEWRLVQRVRRRPGHGLPGPSIGVGRPAGIAPSPSGDGHDPSDGDAPPAGTAETRATAALRDH
jgi:DMSO reductase family type II enzyme heme b subunit